MSKYYRYIINLQCPVMTPTSTTLRQVTMLSIHQASSGSPLPIHIIPSPHLIPAWNLKVGRAAISRQRKYLMVPTLTPPPEPYSVGRG